MFLTSVILVYFKLNSISHNNFHIMSPVQLWQPVFLTNNLASRETSDMWRYLQYWQLQAGHSTKLETLLKPKADEILLRDSTTAFWVLSMASWFITSLTSRSDFTRQQELRSCDSVSQFICSTKKKKESNDFFPQTDLKQINLPIFRPNPDVRVTCFSTVSVSRKRQTFTVTPTGKKNVSCRRIDSL